MKIRILLGDGEALVRDGVKRALERAGDFEIVGEASSAAQIGPLVRRTRPDLVLVDPAMGGANRQLTFISAARESNASVPVVLLARMDDPGLIDAAAQLGACGFVSKTIPPDDLPVLLRAFLLGTVAFLTGACEFAMRRASDEHGLSSRELEVLRGVAKGLSNRGIGTELWLSDQTVKFHLRNIYRKLSVANRTEAAQFAFRHGYVA
jgi:DNA-binding NarL/FixJ family response regulator